MTARRAGQTGTFDDQSGGGTYRLIERVGPSVWVVEIIADAPYAEAEHAAWQATASANGRASYPFESSVGHRMRVHFVSHAEYSRHF